MTPYPLKADVVQLLAGSVVRLRNSFDRASGRFLDENGGWAVTHQDAALVLAMLYRTHHSENPWTGNDELFGMACRAGDVLPEVQDDQGRFEFVKADGSTWGYSYMPWPMYHWLETYVTLRTDLEKTREARWQEGLQAAFTGSSLLVGPDGRIHNIPAWHAMALYRAGQIFERTEWQETGTAFLRRVADAQAPDGTWSEGGGPSTLYNMVYVHALGLYFHFSGDTTVLPALEKAATFHSLFTYPDGTKVETVDGRVKYHPSIGFNGFAGFAATKTGLNLIRLMLKGLSRHSFKDIHLPRLAAILPYCPDTIELQRLPQEEEACCSIHADRALIHKAGPWYGCLSAYTVPTDSLPVVHFQRFVMERQNMVSLFHETTGLLVAGGNSKRDPDFSTFCVLDGRVLRTQPDEANVEQTENGGMLRLVYGQQSCCVTLSLENARNATLTFEATPGPANTRIMAGFTMRLHPGHELRAGETHPALRAPLRGGDLKRGAQPSTIDPLHNWRLSLLAETSRPKWVASANWRLTLPADADFAWPVYPFNPYAIDGAAPPEQALARVAVPVEPGGEPKRFRLEILT